MLNTNSWRLTLGVALAVVVMLAASGLASASNMGFKINKAVVEDATAPTDNIGTNWVSLPYNNPYPNAQALCQQLGMRGAVFPAPGDSVTIQVNSPGADSFQTWTCNSTGTPFALSDPPTLNTGLPSTGVQLRFPTGAAGTITSVIIVGSHNPARSVTIPDSEAPPANNNERLFSVPYHTTAVNARDACNQAGLTNVVFPNPGASVIRYFTDGLAGGSTGFQTWVCGTATGTPFSLVLGEAVAIREPNGPKTFIPAHF